MDILQQISDLIAEYSGTSVLVLGVVFELVARFVKSDKLQSIPRMVAKALHLLAMIFEGVSSVVDKVVPDRAPE